jgi:hypothetical protein
MEDGGGPPEDGLQDQFSNHPALRGDEIPGGERIGKRRGYPRQVRARKANASEPLMSCRKLHNCHRKQTSFAVCEEVQRGPAYWLDGGRQIDGAILVQASMRNVGTWRSDAKGAAQGAGTLRAGVPKRGAGTDQLVVAKKPGNAGGAKGLNRPAEGMSQPGRGGAHV